MSNHYGFTLIEAKPEEPLCNLMDNNDLIYVNYSCATDGDFSFISKNTVRNHVSEREGRVRGRRWKRNASKTRKGFKGGIAQSKILKTAKHSEHLTMMGAQNDSIEGEGEDEFDEFDEFSKAPGAVR